MAKHSSTNLKRRKIANLQTSKINPAIRTNLKFKLVNLRHALVACGVIADFFLALDNIKLNYFNEVKVVGVFPISTPTSLPIEKDKQKFGYIYSDSDESDNETIVESNSPLIKKFKK